MTVLQAAYVVDVLVAFPIALTTLLGTRTTAPSVLGERLPDDQGNRILLGSLWTAVAVCAAAGVVLPITMSPVLVLQLIYKTLWIACFALPRWFTGRSREVPWRMAGTFLLYIAAYPWVIPWGKIITEP